MASLATMLTPQLRGAVGHEAARQLGAAAVRQLDATIREERFRACGIPITALTYPLALIGLPLLACGIAWPLSYARRKCGMHDNKMKRVLDGCSIFLLCLVFLFFIMLAAEPSLFYIDDWHGECEDEHHVWVYGRPRDCKPVTKPLCDGQVSKEAKAGAAIAGLIVGGFTYVCVYIGCARCRPNLPPHVDIVRVRNLEKVKCPVGYGAGATIILELPEGERVRTFVPKDVKTGMTFRVELTQQTGAEQLSSFLKGAQGPAAHAESNFHGSNPHGRSQQSEGEMYPRVEDENQPLTQELTQDVAIPHAFGVPANAICADPADLS